MYGLRRFGIKLGLSTITRILEGLGNPQDGIKFIHVAGTNGKGSVASSLATILHLSGYNVGLYTSPHLVRFNERICINNRMISNEDVVLSYEAVKGAHFGTREPTFFEFSTAMALYEFGRQGVDWAVVETGMGGRLDATNIINPVIAVITNISQEHKAYLGNTISEIAREKGGIIKKNVPVITGVKQKNVTAILKTIASSQSAQFYRFGDAFRVRRNRNGTFNYLGIEHVWRNLRTGLIGNHQVDNAALTLAACEVLNKDNTSLTVKNIEDGLKQNKWPGRLEIIPTSPLILLDGAHNFIAARNLSRYLIEHLSNRNITLVVGILDDKPYASMLKCLVPLCHKVILTRPNIDRALAPERLFPIAKELKNDVDIVPDVDMAIKLAIETTPEREAICIAGSLYVVGEAKETFEKHPFLIRKNS
ncbi:MAG: bifunctional folylpolyglutamate synthase/dihydrofolate synthase [Desulfobacterales bacterium]|nr:MAG: bifunctional folylpolyglutamate synthase/dihydrofolate synthase [Desulfobacterales bacterium]